MLIFFFQLSGGQPQVFLAMQTTGLAGQDTQGSPYITLQPVSVDGGELSSNTLVQEGVSLQQAVMTNSNNTSDVNVNKGETLTSENGQQVCSFLFVLVLTLRLRKYPSLFI